MVLTRTKIIEINNKIAPIQFPIKSWFNQQFPAIAKEIHNGVQDFTGRPMLLVIADDAALMAESATDR